MRILQTLVKCLAVLLAISIVGGMITALIFGLSAMDLITGDRDGGTGIWTDSEYREGITKLEVNVKATKVEIRKAKDSETVKMETNNEYVESWTENGALHIVEKSHGIFGFGGTGSVVIYIKEGYKFEQAELEVGAGKIEAEELIAEELELKLGAGKVEIDELKATRELEISGGAGALTIKKAEIQGAKIDLGAGRTEIRKAKFSGENQVKSGVGSLELELLGKESDYQFAIEKGIGSVKLNGRGLEDGTRVGEGKTRMDIESGVGSVEIRTTEE